MRIQTSLEKFLHQDWPEVLANSCLPIRGNGTAKKEVKQKETEMGKNEERLEKMEEMGRGKIEELNRRPGEVRKQRKLDQERVAEQSRVLASLNLLQS